MQDTLKTWLRRSLAPLVRLHRDERGAALEYALVLAVFAIPLMLVSGIVPGIPEEYTLRGILTQWFSALSYLVGWPFL